MATIVTRAGKGSPLTHDEVDDNFDNLNTDKVETSAIGTAAAANTGDFATAAQGTLADSAVQPNDSPTFAGLTTTADVSFGDNDAANTWAKYGTASVVNVKNQYVGLESPIMLARFESKKKHEPSK